MMLQGRNGTAYELGASIGRGGEGEVYDVRGDATLVAKRYHEPLDAAKEAKLRAMVALRNPDLEAHTAWPVDLATSPDGSAALIMKKLVGYVPLHLLFTPMDRKRLFPDRGYNFLLHVAKNLAIALHKIHRAGVVVGDVNEGNVLVNGDGWVAFIDCDSFQITDGARQYLCEVGVPRYTPPELLRLSSFAHTPRTPNTDSFSLAVLLFQLLFLGKHPFAGRQAASTELDEEGAIKAHQFAYSLHNPHKALQPPKASFDIRNLPQPLIDRFHAAFEVEQSRPAPADWAVALDATLKTIRTCPQRSIHNYPAPATECPWCLLENTQRVSYFLDDTVLKQSRDAAAGEQFIHGFKVDRYRLAPLALPATVAGLAPTPVDRRLLRAITIRKAVLVFAIAAAIGVAFVSPWLVLVVAALFGASQAAFWNTEVRAEVRSREARVSEGEEHLSALLHHYNAMPEVPSHNALGEAVSQLLTAYKNAPGELARAERKLEEGLYESQLQDYMIQFPIKDHKIPKFGAAKKMLLTAAGIRTAADISKLNQKKVVGIGPANQQILFSWQRQVASGFTYERDLVRLNAGIATIRNDFDARKARLQAEIRSSYTAYLASRDAVYKKVAQLEAAIRESHREKCQAELELGAFRQAMRGR